MNSMKSVLTGSLLGLGLFLAAGQSGSVFRINGGTATATVDGDLTHTGFVSGAVAYRVPSLVQVVMSRGHKTVHGIVYYAKPALARQVVRVLAPVGGRAVAVTLWRQSGRRWIAVMTRTVRTTSTGYAATYLVSGAKAVSYFLTDKGNGEPYHEGVCGGDKVENVTVTGKVAEKEGKKWLTPTKVELPKR